jgi:hypothetical protein
LIIMELFSVFSFFFPFLTQKYAFGTFEGFFSNQIALIH